MIDHQPDCNYLLVLKDPSKGTEDRDTMAQSWSFMAEALDLVKHEGLRRASLQVQGRDRIKQSLPSGDRATVKGRKRPDGVLEEMQMVQKITSSGKRQT